MKVKRGYIKIDGEEFKVPILSLKRTADFLDLYARRTQSGILKRKLIGVYYNYTVGFGYTPNNPTEYHRLYDKLTEPKEFHTFEVWGDFGAYTFEGYVGANVPDEIKLVAWNGNNWETKIVSGLSVQLISKAPARR